MSYGKGDFLSWEDDINLDELLGDYTCSEFENSDDDISQETVINKAPSSKNTSAAKKKIYDCDECPKSYSSISGIRGHMRLKHGVHNVKASKYRKGSSTDNEPDKPFKIQKDTFDKLISETLPISLVNIGKNKFRNLKSSVSGQGIILLAEHIIQDSDKQMRIQSVLQPMYYDIFNISSENDVNTKEALFQKFYEITSDENIINEVSKIISENCEAYLPYRQFVAVLNRQLMTDMIRQRTLMFQSKESTEPLKPDELSVADQNVIYYIGGYIISAMSRKLNKKSVTKKDEDISTTLQHMLKIESDSEKTFVTKFSAWTEKVNRGGLKRPSDNFFLFVRSCELCVRSNIDEENIHCKTYNIVSLKEKIMENHMVKYYAEKIASGILSSYIIEQCVTIFLTVRGGSAARKRKNRFLESNESTKSLRKVLKDKSNV